MPYGAIIVDMTCRIMRIVGGDIYSGSIGLGWLKWGKEIKWRKGENGGDRLLDKAHRIVFVVLL